MVVGSGSSLNLGVPRAISVLAVNVVAASTAKTFVDGNVAIDPANTITITGHGYATGRKVAATSVGTLPAGLTATNYWVIAVDADTIQLASSAANALLGTAVVISAAAGGGTHTLTPAALSGASLKLQWSLDNTNWFDIANSSQNVSATGVLGWGPDVILNPAYPYLRAVGAITAGQVNSTLTAGVVGTLFP